MDRSGRPITLALALAVLIAGLVACGPAAPLAGEDAPPPPSQEPPPPATHTPAPPMDCPAPTGRMASISPIAPGTAVVEGFEPQIAAYLNTRGSAEGLQATLGEVTLRDGETTWLARTRVETVDVTGDAVPEVVLDLSFFVPYQYAEGGVFVYTCRAGQYEGGAVARLGGQVFTADDPDPGIRAIQDMNGNGVAEIVFSQIEMIGTQANFTRAFRIVEWDGHQFVDLIAEDPLFGDNAARVENGDGEIADTDGDGTLELLLTHGRGRGPEADPDPEGQGWVETWGWDGTAFRVVGSE